MPSKPKRPCGQPGCRNLTSDRYCEAHRKQREQDRGSAASRGYNARWRRERSAFLELNPLCKHCQSDGRITIATVVDHIIPHKGDYQLFWDWNNWQPLCKQHHDSKTAKEDGGFGRDRQGQQQPES